MTDLKALDALIEKVKAGKPGRWTFDALGEEASGLALDAFHGSVDAAIALLEALLPGWVWCAASVGTSEDNPTPIAMVLPDTRPDPVPEKDTHHAYSDTPARALLLATLTAYRAEKEGDT